MGADAGAIARLSRVLVDGRLDAKALDERQAEIPLPGLRPQVLPAEVVADLDELRKFRHFFRNAYVLDLDPGKTLTHGRRVLSVHAAIARAIAELFRHLEAVVLALSGA